MKLLLDQNLSWRLRHELADLFLEVVHVREIGLASAGDAEIWAYARSNEMTIVTKDADFHQRSFLLGGPPRVVWIRRGNCSTHEILTLLRARRGAMEAFNEDPDAAFLVLE